MIEFRIGDGGTGVSLHIGGALPVLRFHEFQCVCDWTLRFACQLFGSLLFISDKANMKGVGEIEGYKISPASDNDDIAMSTEVADCCGCVMKESPL